MKLTIAATALASTISATAASLSDTIGKSFQDVIEDASRQKHRNLAGAIEGQQEITSILKGRRGMKKENGGIVRRIQSKLARKNTELRNQDNEFFDSETDDDMDLGFLSRSLQMSNATFEDVDDEKTIVEELLELCDKGSPELGLSCTCTNVDEANYRIDVFCTYEEMSCYTAPDSCDGNQTFCYMETYELEVLSPGEGFSKICYDVTEPIEFSYCYALLYGGKEVKASGCAFEFNGVECNSCAFVGSECSEFDCNNIDESVGTGSVCGNETVWKKKVQDHLIYGPLPCEGGCNICPGNGAMTNKETIVSLDTGEFYYCYQLNLAALFGYLQFVPGDLCNALPDIVAEPCGCSAPVADPITGEIPLSNGNEPAENPSSVPADGSGGAELFSKIGLGVTAFATSILSWMTA